MSGSLLRPGGQSGLAGFTLASATPKATTSGSSRAARGGVAVGATTSPTAAGGGDAAGTADSAAGGAATAAAAGPTPTETGSWGGESDAKSAYSEQDSANPDGAVSPPQLGRFHTTPRRTNVRMSARSSLARMSSSARTLSAVPEPPSSSDGDGAVGVSVESAHMATELVDTATQAVLSAFSEVREVAARVNFAARSQEAALQSALHGGLDPERAMGIPRRRFRASQVLGDSDGALGLADPQAGGWPDFSSPAHWPADVDAGSAREALEQAASHLADVTMRSSTALVHSLEDSRSRQSHAVSLMETLVDKVAELGARTGSTSGRVSSRAARDDPAVTRAVQRDIASMRARLTEMGSRLAASRWREQMTQAWDAAFTLPSWNQPVLLDLPGRADSLRARAALLSQWRDQINAWVVSLLRDRVQSVFVNAADRVESPSMRAVLRPDTARGVYSEASLFDATNIAAAEGRKRREGEPQPSEARAEFAVAAGALDDQRIDALRKAVRVLVLRSRHLGKDDSHTFVSPLVEAEYMLCLESAVRSANDAVALFADFEARQGWFHPASLNFDDLELRTIVFKQDRNTKKNQRKAAKEKAAREKAAKLEERKAAREKAAREKAAKLEERKAAKEKAAADRKAAMEKAAAAKAAKAAGGDSKSAPEEASSAQEAAGAGEGADTDAKPAVPAAAVVPAVEEAADSDDEDKPADEDDEDNKDEDEDAAEKGVAGAAAESKTTCASVRRLASSAGTNAGHWFASRFHPALSGLDQGSAGPMGSLGRAPIIQFVSEAAWRAVVRFRLQERIAVAERRVRLACLRYQLMQIVRAAGCLAPISSTDGRNPRDPSTRIGGRAGVGEDNDDEDNNDEEEQEEEEEEEEEVGEAADSKAAASAGAAAAAPARRRSKGKRRSEGKRRSKGKTGGGAKDDAGAGSAWDDDDDDAEALLSPSAAQEDKEARKNHFCRPASEFVQAVMAQARLLLVPYSKTADIGDETWPSLRSLAPDTITETDKGCILRVLRGIEDIDVALTAQPWLEAGETLRLMVHQGVMDKKRLGGSFRRAKRALAGPGLARTATAAQVLEDRRRSSSRKITGIGGGPDDGAERAGAKPCTTLPASPLERLAFALGGSAAAEGGTAVEAGAGSAADAATRGATSPLAAAAATAVAGAFGIVSDPLELSLVADWKQPLPKEDALDAHFAAKADILSDMLHRRLRRSGRDFALFDLSCRENMTKLVINAGGATLMETSSHLIRGYGSQHTAGDSYTQCGDLVLLLRPTNAGVQFGAVSLGLRAQVVHSLRSRHQRTGVARDDAVARKAAAKAVRDQAPAILASSSASIVGRPMISNEPCIPERPASPLFWNTLFAAPFAPFSSTPEFAALWRQFRVAGLGGGEFAKVQVSARPKPGAALQAMLDNAVVTAAIEPAAARHDESLEAVASAIVRGADAEDASLAAGAEESPFGPAERRRVARFLLLRLNWPDLSVPAAVVALDNGGTDGGLPDPEDASADSPASALTNLLPPRMAAVLPPSFEYLHDPEVLLHLKQQVADAVEGPWSFLPTVSGPGRLESLVYAASVYLGHRTGRVFSIAYQTAQLWPVLIVFLLLVRLLAVEILRSTLAAEIAATTGAIVATAGDDTKADDFLTLAVQGAYVVFVMFVWCPLVLTTTSRTWAFESLTAGRPVGTAHDPTAVAAHRTDTAARSAKVLAATLETNAASSKPSHFKPPDTVRNGIGGRVAAPNSAPEYSSPSPRAELGKFNDYVTQPQPAWEAAAGEERLVGRRSLYGPTYVLVDWAFVLLHAVLQGLAVWGAFELAQYLESVLDGGDPLNPGVATSVVMVVAVPLAATINHTLYTQIVKPNLLGCCFPLLRHRSPMEAAARSLPVRPNSVASSWRAFSTQTAFRLSRTYTEHDERHDIISYVALMCILYLGPAFYVAVAGERLHGGLMCPDKDCYMQAGLQQLVAQAAFVVSAMLSHACTMSWSQPSSGRRRNIRATAPADSQANIGFCSCGYSSALTPVRLFLQYLLLGLCRSPTLTSLAGVHSWSTFFVRTQPDNAAIAVRRRLGRLPCPSGEACLDCDDDGTFLATFKPAQRGAIAVEAGLGASREALHSGRTLDAALRSRWAPASTAVTAGPGAPSLDAPDASATARTELLDLGPYAAGTDSIPVLRQRFTALYDAKPFSAGFAAVRARQAAEEALVELTKLRRSAGHSLAAEAALLQLTAPGSPRRGGAFSGSDAELDQRWWLALQPVLPAAADVAADAKFWRVPAADDDAASDAALARPSAAGRSSAASIELTPAARATEEEEQGVEPFNATLVPKEVASDAATGFEDTEAKRKATVQALNAGRRNLHRSRQHVTARPRRFTALPDSDVTKDLPRLQRSQLHDDSHSLAIQAFLFASTVLLCGLPHPYVPILGFIYAFIEARLLTVRRVFGTKAEPPRPSTVDTYHSICAAICFVGFVTNGCLGAFTRAFDWDGTRSDVLYVVIIVLLIGPFALFGIQRVILAGFESCSVRWVCCGRLSAQNIILRAEVPYRHAVERIFEQTERLKLHARDSSGTLGLNADLP